MDSREIDWDRTLRICRWAGSIKERVSNYVKFDGSTFFYTEKDGIITCEGSIDGKLFTHSVKSEDVEGDPEWSADKMFVALVRKCLGF
jgi:hypothetical protein